MAMQKSVPEEMFRIFISRFSSPIISNIIEEDLIGIRDLLLMSLFKFHFAITRVLQQYLNKSQANQNRSTQAWERIFQAIDRRLLRHEKLINELFVKFSQALMVLSLDSRFPGLNVHNKAFLLYKLKELIDTGFRQFKGQAQLDFFAAIDFIFGDLNALKPVNEFAGMKNGDKLLYRVAYIMAKSLRIKSFAEKNSLTLTLFALGGDEFAILIQKTNGPSDAKAALSRKLSRIIREEVKKIDLSDVLSFANRKIRKKIKKAGLAIPDNFEKGGSPIIFRTSIATGVSNLSSAILGLTPGMEEEIKLVVKEEAREKELTQQQQISLKHLLTVHKILGIFLDTAENGCKKQKARQKKKLRLSKDPVDNFFYLLMMRNAEAIELAQELLATQKALGKSFELNHSAGQLTNYAKADDLVEEFRKAA